MIHPAKVDRPATSFKITKAGSIMEADGKLSQAEKSKIAEWLSTRGQPPACPYCKSSQWVIADHLLNLTPYTPGGAFTIGGTSYPFVVLVSEGCGHSVFFSAVMIGVVPGAAPSDKG
jgi:hypothetical protein